MTEQQTPDPTRRRASPIALTMTILGAIALIGGYFLPIDRFDGASFFDDRGYYADRYDVTEAQALFSLHASGGWVLIWIAALAAVVVTLRPARRLMLPIAACLLVGLVFLYGNLYHGGVNLWAYVSRLGAVGAIAGLLYARFIDQAGASLEGPEHPR